MAVVTFGRKCTVLFDMFMRQWLIFCLEATNVPIFCLDTSRELAVVWNNRCIFDSVSKKNIIKQAYINPIGTQWDRKFKKVQAKKLMKSNKSNFFFPWNCIYGNFKLFPSSKIDFWPFLKLQKKKGFGALNFFAKLINLISRGFFWDWTFLNFLSHCILGLRS